MFFFYFPGFTDFERAVTLLVVKIFLNFKNGKKAMSKLFLKPLINFLFNEVFMPKTPCDYKYHSRFLPRLCVATENIWGGGGCEESAFLNTVLAMAFFWGKRWGEGWGE
jgi:hypothetical protein